MVSHSLLAGTVFTNTDGCHPPAWRKEGHTWDVTVCPKAHTLQPGLQMPSVPPSQLLNGDSDRSAEQRTGVHRENPGDWGGGGASITSDKLEFGLALSLASETSAE